MSREGEEGRLSRWSRLKREAAKPASPAPEPEEGPGAEGVVVETQDETPGEPSLEALSEPEQLERLGLPDPDTLEKGADFTAFLKTGVPEALRRRALRRLWRSDPTLACLDGLNDYDEDYRAAAAAGGAFKSAWKAGRGYLDRLAEREREAEAARAEAEARADPGAGAGPGAEETSPPQDRPEAARSKAVSLPEATARDPRPPAGSEQAARAGAPGIPGGASPAPPVEPPAPPRPRRMRFATAADDESREPLS